MFAMSEGMAFLLSILLAFSPVASAEILGKGEMVESSEFGKSSTAKRKSAPYQGPRPLVDPDLASIVRPRLPARIQLGQYCIFKDSRGDREEARFCLLRRRAQLVGSTCRPQRDCARSGRLRGTAGTVSDSPATARSERPN